MKIRTIFRTHKNKIGTRLLPAKEFIFKSRHTLIGTEDSSSPRLKKVGGIVLPVPPSSYAHGP